MTTAVARVAAHRAAPIPPVRASPPLSSSRLSAHLPSSQSPLLTSPTPRPLFIAIHLTCPLPPSPRSLLSSSRLTSQHLTSPHLSSLFLALSSPHFSSPFSPHLTSPLLSSPHLTS